MKTKTTIAATTGTTLEMQGTRVTRYNIFFEMKDFLKSFTRGKLVCEKILKLK